MRTTWSVSRNHGSTGCLVPDVMKTSMKYKNMSSEERIEAAKAIYFFVHADRMRYGTLFNQINAGVVQISTLLT